MTPGYVARSWTIPRSNLEAALVEFAQPGSRATLQQIADEKGISLSELTIFIEAVIATARISE